MPLETKIINDKKYCWYYCDVDNKKIYFKGFLFYSDSYYHNKQACHRVADIYSSCLNNHSMHGIDEGTLKNNILKLSGHFSFIVDGPDYVLAVVDKIRSFPIYYSKKENNSLFVSNSARKLQSETSLNEKDKDSVLEFEMAGYVTGGKTLVKGLYQLKAGEALMCFKKDTKVMNMRYYLFYSDDLNDKSEEDSIEELHYVTIKTFSEMIETLNGRPVWIPLSGGLDSRLVVTMLKELKYDNICTFSYGITGSKEVERAGAIAKYLGVRWHRVVYKPRETRRMFYKEERKRYFQFADGLCSTPFLNDFYALLILREKKLIPDDAIFINGQTGDFITGGHIPVNLADDSTQYDISFLIHEIVDKHFSLWLNLKNDNNLKAIADKMLKTMDLTLDTKLSSQDAAKYYELWEWQERQSKFVVNGQRIYEWFGYEWRLPLWSDVWLDFWSRAECKDKFKQRLYKSYLYKKNIMGIFDKYTGPHPLNHWYKIASFILFHYSDLIGKDRECMSRKYLHYFMNYAPFYNQRTYFEYLKDSFWHRNPFSYISKEVLKTCC